MLCTWQDKKIYQIGAMILGVVSIVFGIVLGILLPEEAHNLMHFAGMLTGFGTGIVCVAGYHIIRDRIMPEEKKREREIERNDERNIQITRAAYAVVAATAFFVNAVLSFVFVLLGDFRASIFMMCSIYVEAIVFVIAYRVLSKKM